MCVYSMVADHWRETFPQKHPAFHEFILPPQQTQTVTDGPSREEFEALRKDVLDLKELLRKAKIYDEKTGQKDCEMEEKVAFIRNIAKFLGVDLGGVV